MKEFQEKVVVITGGATGIGFSFAKRFGEEGAKIVVAARRENRLQEAVEKLKELGIEAGYYTCDVSDPTSVERLAEQAWNDYGKIDVLINNAGIAPAGTSIIDMNIEEFTRVYNINVFGVINGITAFGRRFIEQGTPAAIYNVGSENSLFNGVPYAGAYVSSKHAILAISESLKEEVPEFIDVGLIMPGFVNSELGESMHFGMDTDKYTSLAMKQIKNGEFFIVSHAYNMVHVEERYTKISNAFTKYAPRYENDAEFDVRTIMARMNSG